jgi:hypothetical protein
MRFGLRRSTALLFLSAAAACSNSATQGPPERTGKAGEALHGGTNDTSDAVSDVVVYLSVGCTGTLITPSAVLTAKHCVCGAPDGIDVHVGDATSTGLLYRSTTADPHHPAHVFGTCPQPLGDYGDDVAIIFIDDVQSGGGYEASWAFDYPYIHRPTFVAPCASDSSSCPDANGGTYNPAFGMAGFALPEGSSYRQIAFPNVLHHYPGAPILTGQYWKHATDIVSLDHGDSGGPLFIARTDETGHAFRDVLGVASEMHSGGGDDYDYWTDITRGAIKDWVIQTMTDHLPGHTAAWRAAHPKLTWIGEVDYLGPCQQSLDADCDHFYDADDNCPAVFNPNQYATQGIETGDACNGPVGCVVHAPCELSNSFATFSCTGPAPKGIVQSRPHGTTGPWSGTLAYVDPSNPGSYDYRVCADFSYGTACTPPMPALPDPSCMPSCAPSPSLSCPAGVSGPPEVTVTCQGTADFWAKSLDGTTTELGAGTQYTVTGTDFQEYLLACTPGLQLSQCVSYSTAVDRSLWCAGAVTGGGTRPPCKGPNCCIGTCQ